MKIKVAFAPEFFHRLKKLAPDLQEEAIEKVDLFKNRSNHRKLKVHKLKGRLEGRYSFSVNYKYRIIFIYLKKDEAYLETIGGHDIYK